MRIKPELPETDEQIVARVKQEIRQEKLLPEFRTDAQLYKNLYSIQYRIKMRRAILDLLGNCCSGCGIEDERVLQIDHIHGGGSKDKKSIQGTYYKRVIQSLVNEENKYQLLCANCNWIKRAENGETRGRI